MKHPGLIIFTNLLLIGCVSNKPILLDSPIHSQQSVTVNPSLSMPEKGFHPYIGVGFGADKQSVFDTSYYAPHFDVNLGMLRQPSLVKGWTVGFFYSLNSKLNYSKYRFLPNDDSLDKMNSSEEDLFNERKSSFGLEVAARLGLVSKFKIGALALYVCGLGQYENGPYYYYRKELDGIGNYYNLSIEKQSIGYGFGGDLSFGRTGDWDVGIIIESHYISTKTQSYKSDHIEDGSYIVEVSDGGTDFTLEKGKVEYYFDSENIRVSMALGFPHDTTFTFVYKF